MKPKSVSKISQKILEKNGQMYSHAMQTKCRDFDF